MSNVNYSMKIEDVRINFLTYVKDTLLKRGSKISWSSIKEDKRHIGDNTVTYLVEVNNGYKKEVTFRLVQVTTKLTNDDNVRRQYTEIVMEDIDDEFGKLICTPNDVKNATNAMKNKMTVEYRKTLTKRMMATKELQNQNELLNKRINEKEQIEKSLRNSKAKAELESSLLRADKVLLEGQVENQLMVIKEQKNEIVALQEQLKTVKKDNRNKKLSRLVWKKLIREIVTKYNNGTSIDKLVDFVLEFLEK